MIGARIEGAILNFSTALISVSLCVMFFEATSRSLVSQSHWWAEELVRFLVVWSVLLSLGVANRRGHYIRMDLILLMLPAGIQRLLGWLNALLGLTFSGALVYAGVLQVLHLEKLGMMTESNLDLPLWFIRLALPLGGILYALYFFGSMRRLLRGEDERGDLETRI